MVTQYQGSLTDQLRALVPVANFHGMYDAADFLTTIVTKTDARCRECGSGLTERNRRMEPIVTRPPSIPKAIGGRPC